MSEVIITSEMKEDAKKCNGRTLVLKRVNDKDADCNACHYLNKTANTACPKNADGSRACKPYQNWRETIPSRLARWGKGIINGGIRV